MCPINDCLACETERTHPGVYIRQSNHFCMGRQYMGADLGQMEMRESTRSTSFSAGTHRYALTELWPYHKRIKPINQLSTPHLRNIVALFDSKPEKLGQVTREEGAAEAVQLQMRVDNVRAELARRDNDLKNKVYNMRVRCDGMVSKVKRFEHASAYSMFEPPPDMHEVRAVFNGVAELLKEVEETLSKVD